jgi:hypothetical protein
MCGNQSCSLVSKRQKIGQSMACVPSLNTLYQIRPLTRNPTIPTPKLTAQHCPVTKHDSSGYHNHPSSFDL